MHGLCCRAQKVLPPPPLLLVGIVQPQPRFMDEGCCLECLPGPLPGHPVRSHPAEFFIGRREQLVGSIGIAIKRFGFHGGS